MPRPCKRTSVKPATRKVSFWESRYPPFHEGAYGGAPGRSFPSCRDRVPARCHVGVRVGSAKRSEQDISHRSPTPTRGTCPPCSCLPWPFAARPSGNVFCLPLKVAPSTRCPGQPELDSLALDFAAFGSRPLCWKWKMGPPTCCFSSRAVVPPTYQYNPT